MVCFALELYDWKITIQNLNFRGIKNCHSKSLEKVKNITEFGIIYGSSKNSVLGTH